LLSSFVIGATGMIGTPVTKELIKAGFEVTAFVRSIENEKHIFSSGVSFFQGDLKNKTDIAAAIKDADAVYISISSGPTDTPNGFNPEASGVDNIIAALKASSVKQVGFLSSFLARNYKGAHRSEERTTRTCSE
jgi:uncharacterized protein YbjT (DUF2867 family)